ncbi:MAG: tetratricopeptide repeat protein [Proteobacteria bacterium]|nr:tetratricopeptide repeat protein [Pseudomonadota bacterium]
MCVWAFFSACSAPALSPDLADAEAAEAAGDNQRALVHYDAALRSCAAETNPTARRRMCASAHVGRAELLDRIGEKARAARAYARIARVLPGHLEASSTGVYRAGRLYLELGDARTAYSLLWRAVTDYPDQGYAADALRVLLRDGRQRNPRELYRVMGDLLQPLSRTGVADNLLYAIADLAENENGDQRAALGFYDKITVEYPGSGLRDDAFWHAARLARVLGDGPGAARRLRQLLATREVAFGAGSYNSIWFDNAQLELGRILRDDLDDPWGAVAAFARLPRDYPASVLIDDALWETASTWDRVGDRQKTCTALARLSAWPDSKYEIELAPALRNKRGCPCQLPTRSPYAHSRGFCR